MDRAVSANEGSESDFAALCMNGCYTEPARASSVPIFEVFTLDALAIGAPSC
jgi:hypothetical protein